ncbi:MAG TPA: FTR1 family protein [Chloroflexota bacterium]|nr:FTR1 family protein [Chloroflexota bacterium]
MELTAAAFGLVTASLLASAVETVEAFTIVLAMGLTRDWKSALAGTLLALVVLVALTLVAGTALVTWISDSALQLVIGTLMLIFGLQWLRKAILRSSGLKALHDEELTFREEQEAARRAGKEIRFGLDWFSFMVSFKGVFLEGLEVIFIIIAIGVSGQRDVPNAMVWAATGAAIGAAIAVGAGLVLFKPLSRVPENTLKYTVGLLLATLGTYWTVEGAGFLVHGESLEWPGGSLAIGALLATWLVVSRAAVLGLRQLPGARKAMASVPAVATS